MLTPEGYESLIFKILFVSEEIRDRVLPYLQKEVFDSNKETRTLFETLNSYEEHYEKFPTENEFSMFLKTENLTTKWNEIKSLDVSEDLADSLSTLDQIENYIKYKLVFLAKDEMTDALLSQDFTKVGTLQEKINEALGFSFNSEIGIEPFDSIDVIYEELTRKDACITTGVNSFDKTMGGGWPTKTLNLVIAGTNIGKTHFMCSNALAALLNGNNVLYVTFEDSRAEIARRIFQNLCSIKREETMIKDSFMKIFNREKARVKGKIRVFEAEGGIYSAHKLHTTLKDLKMKNEFVPDIIFLDYLAYMVSYRGGKNARTDEKLKFVAQELKALAFKTGIPIVSAAQLNRTGFGSKNPGLEDLAECFALSNIADNAWVFTTNEELYSQKMMSAIMTKSRVGGKYSKFFINCDPDIQRVWSEENDKPSSARDDDLLDDYNVAQLKKIKETNKPPQPKISYDLF